MQLCTTVHGVPKRFQENRTRNVPSGKMLLESFGLNQCQGNCVQLFRSKSRVHLEGVSVIVLQVAKHPNICRHRWNPNPKRARKRYDYSVWIGWQYTECHVYPPT